MLNDPASASRNPIVRFFRRRGRPAAAASGLVISILVSGCTAIPMPAPHTIRVEIASALVGSSLQVDVIGVNSFELPKWQTYSVSRYWTPGDPLRRDAEKVTFRFAPGVALTLQLPADDSIWTRWLRSGTAYLVLLSDLPGAVSDQLGNDDPRRIVLPLDTRLWGNLPIHILVEEKGLRVLTPMTQH